jgi:hypothetical protein
MTTKTEPNSLALKPLTRMHLSQRQLLMLGAPPAASGIAMMIDASASGPGALHTIHTRQGQRTAHAPHRQLCTVVYNTPFVM